MWRERDGLRREGKIAEKQLPPLQQGIKEQRAEGTDSPSHTDRAGKTDASAFDDARGGKDKGSLGLQSVQERRRHRSLSCRSREEIITALQAQEGSASPALRPSRAGRPPTRRASCDQSTAAALAAGVGIRCESGRRGIGEGSLEGAGGSGEHRGSDLRSRLKSSSIDGSWSPSIQSGGAERREVLQFPLAAFTWRNSLGGGELPDGGNQLDNGDLRASRRDGRDGRDGSDIRVELKRLHASSMKECVRASPRGGASKHVGNNQEAATGMSKSKSHGRSSRMDISKWLPAPDALQHPLE